VDAAYWSLAIEVKFYVLVAVIYGVLREKFWMGLIAAAALGFALEFWHPALARGVFLSQYMSFFLAGTALAFQTTLQKGHAALTLYASAAIAYVAHWQTISLHDGSTLLPNLVVIGAILAVILVTIKGIRIDYGPLPFLGIISYEIYLLHQRLGVIVISIAKGRLGTSDLLAGLLAAGLCTSSAFIVNRYLQKPVQGLIGAFWRRLRPE
jgi:peptidoglycan/LPS O-acetylase OafA/YrhL